MDGCSRRLKKEMKREGGRWWLGRASLKMATVTWALSWAFSPDLFFSISGYLVFQWYYKSVNRDKSCYSYMWHVWQKWWNFWMSVKILTGTLEYSYLRTRKFLGVWSQFGGSVGWSRLAERRNRQNPMFQMLGEKTIVNDLFEKMNELWFKRRKNFQLGSWIIQVNCRILFFSPTPPTRLYKRNS